MKVTPGHVITLFSTLVANSQLSPTKGLSFYTGQCDDSVFTNNEDEFDGTYSTAAPDENCDYVTYDACTVDASSMYSTSFTTTCNDLGGQIVIYDEYVYCPSTLDSLVVTNRMACMDSTCTEADLPDPYTAEGSCPVTQSNIRLLGSPPAPSPVFPDPTSTPVSPPTSTPVSSPTSTPVNSPTSTPVNSPTESPVGLVSPPTPDSSPVENPVGPDSTPEPGTTGRPTFPPTISPVELASSAVKYGLSASLIVAYFTGAMLGLFFV